MAVAAAIGVEAEEAIPNVAMGPRLQNKMKMMQPNHLGDINRSIEKMSIGNNSFNPPNTCPSMGQAGTTMPVQANNRRGSNWTNSTEGYGSMRSEQSMMSSRRCSDVSVAMSQGSNVPQWDPMSADSSRRSSMASNHGGNVQDHQVNINNHLDRLHRRASKQNQMQVTPVATPTPMMNMVRTPTNVLPPQPMPNHAQQPMVNHGSGRRASDPVRMLDRNFGVEGQMSRHGRSGSFGPVQPAAQPPRVPIHGQRIRGMSGDTYFQQQQSNAQQMVRKFHIFSLSEVGCLVVFPIELCFGYLVEFMSLILKIRMVLHFKKQNQIKKGSIKIKLGLLK